LPKPIGTAHIATTANKNDLMTNIVLLPRYCMLQYASF
jgi:hypothetical protein